MRFIFQHGWGFSRACWQGWLEQLNSPFLLGDRGYWGAPSPLTAFDPQSDHILVTHSLGLHLLPNEILTQASLIVVISGFAHFHGRGDGAGRFSRRHVHKMLSRMESDPVGLIRDFHRDCACPEWWPIDDSTMNPALLTQDLILLDQSRMDEAFCQGLPPLLLLHGQDDRIVRPELALELAGLVKGSRLTVIKDAGHGLPFTHPELCLDLIRVAYGEQRSKQPAPTHP